MSYTEPRHPMKVVVRRTGLTSHALRVWERRYGAVVPDRTNTNRRLYSDADIDRLRLLRLATSEGHSIGRIAKLSEDELRELISDEGILGAKAAGTNGQPVQETPTPPDHRGLLERSKKAVMAFRNDELEAALMEAKLTLSVPVLLEELVTPLLVWIGEGWRDGTARIAHEHLMSATIRKFLGEMRPLGSQASADAPAIVVATPRGQLHETGALMTAILAASEGWRDIYLGPNIPMEEIVNTVRATNARAVALSIIYPNDDASLPDELTNLARFLDGKAVLLVGGMGSKAYRGVLDELGAIWLEDLQSFRRQLEAIRDVDDVRNLQPGN